MPELEKLYQELTAKYDRFEMISISYLEPEDRTRKVVEQYHLSWPQAALEDNSKLVADYGVIGAPYYFLVGPDGKIVSTSGRSQIAAAVANTLETRTRKRAKSSVEKTPSP